MDAGTRIARSADIGAKVGLLLRRRSETAVKQFTDKARSALDGGNGASMGIVPGQLPMVPMLPTLPACPPPGT